MVPGLPSRPTPGKVERRRAEREPLLTAWAGLLPWVEGGRSFGYQLESQQCFHCRASWRSGRSPAFSSTGHSPFLQARRALPGRANRLLSLPAMHVIRSNSAIVRARVHLAALVGTSVLWSTSLVVKKGSNTLDWMASGIPVTVSRTRTSTHSPGNPDQALGAGVRYDAGNGVSGVHDQLMGAHELMRSRGHA